MGGNRQCYIARLKDNMTEIDGEIHQIDLGNDFPSPKHRGCTSVTASTISHTQ